MNNTLKKTISVITSVTTVAWLSGVAMLIPMQVGAADLVDGDLIRNPNAEGAAQLDIYITKQVGDKKFKRLILSPHVFESYEHFDKNGNGNNWDDVVDVDAATMAEYETTDLVRVDGNDKVYRLYAEEGADTGTKYWLNMTAEEFTAEFDADAIYTINSTDTAGYDSGQDITEPTATFPPSGTVSDGSLSCSLAADTPAAGIAVEGAARLAFTKVNCTATGGDVVVDELTVERTGLAQDGAFSSIDIVDGDNVPYNNTSKTFNSQHQATFKDDITIEGGTTESIILAANMAATLTSYAGETPKLALTDIQVKDDASVSASLPIEGNVMTINNTISIGSATIQRGSYTNSSSTSIQVGKEDYTFLSFQVQAGSVEKVEFDQVKVYQEGSASLGSDIINLELYQDSTKIADADVSSSKYATFSFDAITLDKGETAQFQVKADVDSGSARTIDLGIYKTTDLIVKGVTYGYYITPTYTGSGSSANSPVLSDNEFTISNGTLTVTKSNDVATGNISVANDQELGAYKFTVKGESINVSALTLTITSSSTSTIEDALTGVELVDESGDVVAGPTDLTAGALTVAWTDTFTLPVGETVYKVRGDLATNGGWASDDTISVAFTPSAMTATGDTTGNAITASPSSAVSGNTQTVQAAKLTATINSTPSAGSIITGGDEVSLSSWNLSAVGSGEDVRITSILFAGRGWAATNTQALTLYVDGEARSGDVQDALAANTTGGAATTTFALTDPIIIEKGETVDITLKGTKSTVDSDATENWGLTDTAASIIAYGVSTGQSFNETITTNDGPTLTSRAKGMVTIDLASKPASGIMVSGSTGNNFVNVEMTSMYEDVNLEDLKVYLKDGAYGFSPAVSSDDVDQVCIYDGTDELACANMTADNYATFDFGTDPIVLTKYVTKTLSIKADLATISTTDNQPGTAGADIQLGFGGANSMTFKGITSGQAITGAAYEIYNDSTSSYQVMYKSKPIITYSTSDNTLGAASSLTNGDVDIFAFKVSADSDGGDVLLYRGTIVVNTSTGANGTVASIKVVDEDDNILKTAGSLVDIDGYAGGLYTFTFNNPDVSLNNTTEPIKIVSGDSKTFTVQATINGATTAEYIKVFLAGDTASSTTNFATHYADSGTYTARAGGWLVPTTDLSDATLGKFVWSDNWQNNSIGSVTSNATSSAQWYNSYLVDGFENVVSTTAYTLSY